jgi:hypothetical protein
LPGSSLTILPLWGAVLPVSAAWALAEDNVSAVVTTTVAISM